MGRDIACDADDGNVAVLMMSDLTDGSTTAWCGQCLPGLILSMAAELNPSITVSGVDEPIGLLPVEHVVAVLNTGEGFAVNCTCGWVGDVEDDPQDAATHVKSHNDGDVAWLSDDAEVAEATESAPTGD